MARRGRLVRGLEGAKEKRTPASAPAKGSFGHQTRSDITSFQEQRQEQAGACPVENRQHSRFVALSQYSIDLLAWQGQKR
jgi:hypothetical protein